MNASPSVGDLVRAFGRIGLLSFGGPAGQIALMHRELVDRLGWLTEREYLSALSFCMILPGPEAMQLATYAGWKLRGVTGGLIAGGLFVLPGAAVVLALALGYVMLGDVPIVEAVFLGIKAAVVVIVIQALLRISRRALGSVGHWVLAGLSFLGIFIFGIPFPLIIAAAALWGAATALPGGAPVPLPRPHGTLRTVAVWSGLWVAPIGVLWASGATFLTEVAIFFSKLAVVTFGGAYAVLAYMTQEVVEGRGWLTLPEMMDGLGLAETTPGPLILVTEFVGFLAGFRDGGVTLGLAAAAVTLWVTFMPCFLWIFAGAPYLEWIASRPRLTAALSAVTAAVVGVILNLSLWFAAHVFFRDVGRLSAGPVETILPDPASLDSAAVLLALGAGALLFGTRLPLAAVLAAAAAAGAVTGLFA
jgi:chromate transporter